MGLGYRWNLDFVDLLSLTLQHNCYVLVMTEQFSKWLELVPLLDDSSEGATYAFLDRMLNKFNVPVEDSPTMVRNFKGIFKIRVKRHR